MPRLVETPGAGLRIDHADFVLSDAQLRFLPTVPVEVLTCPATAVLGVLDVSIVLRSLVAAYTNIDPTCKLIPFFTGGVIQALAPLDEAAGDITALLATGAAIGSMHDVVVPAAVPLIGRQGIGLSLKMTNGAAGNLTGGDPTQVIQVHITYYVRSV